MTQGKRLIRAFDMDYGCEDSVGYAKKQYERTATIVGDCFYSLQVYERALSNASRALLELTGIANATEQKPAVASHVHGLLDRAASELQEEENKKKSESVYRVREIESEPPFPLRAQR